MNSLRHNFDNASLNIISKKIFRALPEMKEEIVETIEKRLLKQFDAFPGQNIIDLPMTYNEKKYEIHCSIKDSKTRVFKINRFFIRAIPKTFAETMTFFRRIHALSIDPVRIPDSPF